MEKQPLRLYQLKLEASLNREWTGTVWYSRLYQSEEACITGCLTGEITDIAETLNRYYPASSNGDFDEFAEDHPDRVKCLAEIKEWLQGEEYKYFRDPTEDNGGDVGPVFWEIRQSLLSPDNIWVCKHCKSNFMLNHTHPEVQSGDYYILDEHNRIPCPWCAGWMYLAEGAKGGNAC